MSDRALAADETVDHTPGPLPGSQEFAMDAEIARLRLLNRLEARLAQAIRRMVQPSISPARRERRARALQQAEERRTPCAAPANRAGAPRRPAG